MQLEKYIKPGKLGKDVILSIAQGLTIRVKFDHNIQVVLDEGEIGELLNEAEHFD